MTLVELHDPGVVLMDPSMPHCDGVEATRRIGGLHVSEATAKTHINHLFAKAGVSNRGQAIAYAHDHGLAG
ncbi:MAG: response regulator transcription factor [Acidimicrobiales bacterium]